MTEPIILLEPPATFDEIQRGRYAPLPADDPIAVYWQEEYLKPGAERLFEWQVARLSNAVYLYQDLLSGQAVAVKFYTVKTGDRAPKHAAHELELTQQARALFEGQDAFRVIDGLANWRGVLFFEYVQGLTLEDIIAVRHSQPGMLFPSLELSASFLATLHLHGADPDGQTDFRHEIAFANKMISQLCEHGVLKDAPVVREGLERLVDQWAQHAPMTDYMPAFSHGDATTSNFIFPHAGGMVAIDWERAGYSDPAADLGRIMAEVSHSVKQHGGSFEEAQPVLEHLVNSYCREIPTNWDANAIIERARFYRAISTLRIARNGWVSRLDRMTLIAQAMALLTELSI